MSAIQTRIAQSRPWQRWGMALLAGGGVTLAMPPLYIVPLLLISLPLFALLIEASPTVRSRIALGWWFGAGYMVSSLYWVANALEIVGAPPLLAMALPLSMAGYYVLLAVMYGALCSRTKSRVVIFAICWMVAEILRGTLFTGFPWNLLAHVWAVSDITTQTAALFGSYGLSSLTALMAASPLAMLGKPLRARATWLPLLGTGSALVVMIVFGVVQLRSEANPPPTDKRVRIVQANIPQKDKWAFDKRGENFVRHMVMSEPRAGKKIDLLIWPEAAVPYFLTEEPARTVMMGRLVTAKGMVLAGTTRRQIMPDGTRRYFNSMAIIDAGGHVIATFDKFHLVPFGEYVPFHGLLKWFGVEKVVEGAGDFSPGPGPQVIVLPDLPAVSPLICFDAIFPGAAVPAGARPGWLLNVTNDGWYGPTSGPYQHLVNTRFRAIEEGLPLLRAAGTGISAIVDARGRVIRQLGLNKRGALDGYLPAPLNRPTLYARWGNWSVLILWLVILTVAAVMKRLMMRDRDP